MSERPILLDLYCGAGGAAMGYHRAGFEVVGVDIDPQPNYPFAFIQADALRALEAGTWKRAAAIHASPPCQRYSSSSHGRWGAANPERHPDLYRPTVEALRATGLPWVVENVIGAPYEGGVVLCGSMFGLEAEGEWIQRHRNFESSFMLMGPPACAHPPGVRPCTITGSAFVSSVREYSSSRQATWELAQRMMGIDWMTRAELVESIPPAYTEWVGHRLMEAVTISGAVRIGGEPGAIAPRAAGNRTDPPLRPNPAALPSA